MADSKLRLFNGEAIDMFWWNRHCEDGDAGYRHIKDSKGNPSFGAYGLNKSHTLVAFMQICIEYDSEKYDGFKQFVELGPEELLNNPKLETLWVSYCNKDITEFGALQDNYAFDIYYIPAKKVAINAGVPIDDYSPVLKGSLWSFAIRSGASKGAKKIINAYKNGAKEELALLKAAYSAYGNNDANRWSTSSTVSQYADAVKIYKATHAKVEEKLVAPISNSIKADIQKESIVAPVEEPIDEDKEEVAVAPMQTDESHIKVEIINEEKMVDPKPEVVNEPYEYNSVDETYEKYYVGTEWRKGQCVNKKYVSSNYDDTKEQCVLFANEDNKTYYVFNSKGIKLFISKPDIKKIIHGYDGSMDGYIIATDFINGKHVNLHGKSNNYNTAVRIADIASKDGKRYKVFLNGDLLYTASTK